MTIIFHGMGHMHGPWSHPTRVDVARGPRREFVVGYGPPRVARVHYSNNFKLPEPRVALLSYTWRKLDMYNFWWLVYGWCLSGAREARR